MSARDRLAGQLGDGSDDDALVQVRVGDLREALCAGRPDPAAGRWQDVVLPLVRSERARLEEHLAWTRQLPVTTETARAFREHEGARIAARIAPLDAALARLAEPERSAEVPGNAAQSPEAAEWGRQYSAHVDAYVPLSEVARSKSTPTAAARWRAVPREARRGLLATVERVAAKRERDAERICQPHLAQEAYDEARARRALLALAREAEGGT